VQVGTLEADHGHEHGFAPWRYMILLIPLILYFLQLPNRGFTPVGNAPAFQKLIYYFTGILYEAMPFIVLGVVIAGLLEELVPQRIITRIIPQNRILAIAIGGTLGVLFPMCECGIIPVMRRLLRKGVPLSCCVCYMLAGPIINVVVMLSTFVAFTSSTDVYVFTLLPGWSFDVPFAFLMMAMRMGLGFLVAFNTSLIVEWQFRKHGIRLLSPRSIGEVNTGAASEQDAEPAARKTPVERVANISETALHDFVDIMVFLIIGAMLAALTRILLPRTVLADILNVQPALAIAVMMGLAILLCICSEADAFVAASFASVPATAKLGFLVLGPMLDLKLYMMFTRVFRPRLIWTIILALIVQVFLYTTLFHHGMQLLGATAWTEATDSNPALHNFDLDKEAAKSCIVLAAGPSPLQNVVLARWLIGGKVEDVDFKTLEGAAADEDDRKYWQGRNIRVKGQFMPRSGSDQAFQLVRYKMKCCSADAIPIQVVMFCSQSVADIAPGNWVQVTGQISFAQVSQNRWVTVLRVPRRAEIKAVEPDYNPYVQ
jgi:uncharacterized membrane protein YraQ (UPF0718 family)